MLWNCFSAHKTKRLGSQRLRRGCFQECLLGGGRRGLAWGPAEMLSCILVNSHRLALLSLELMERPLLPGCWGQRRSGSLLPCADYFSIPTCCLGQNQSPDSSIPIPAPCLHHLSFGGKVMGFFRYPTCHTRPLLRTRTGPIASDMRPCLPTASPVMVGGT